MGFVHAAGFAAARRCLRFLVVIVMSRHLLSLWAHRTMYYAALH